MPIEQKKTKVVVKEQDGLVHILPETSIDAVDGLASELQTVVHNVGAESIDGVKTFAKNTMTNAIALNGGSTIDVSLGSFFTKTITSDTTFTFTGVPAGKTCIFSLILTNAGAFNITFPNSVTWAAGASPSFHVIGKDCMTFFTTDGGTSWLEVSGGGGGGAINDSGVVAGSYGPSTNETPSYGETFTVPQITVNQKGQVTNAVNKSITIPSSDNTDVKVAVVENGWAKAYLLGADAAAYQISGSPVGVTATADSAIYLGSSPGNLHATTFNGALNGNATSATKATNDANDARIDTTYAKLASPALTGTPTAPTAAVGTSTTQIATAEFVQNAINLHTESVIAVSGSEIDLSLGRAFTKTVSSATTFSITNAPAGKMTTFTLGLTNGGAYSLTWPNSVEWNGGNIPSFPASGFSIISFTTFDGGTHWYATVMFS